ncbi:MAG: glycosyltransferase family 2 protein [Pseudomonadota bacterium]
MPEISFLMPVHNGARFLAETLESLLTQDHPDYDIIVVDDGSTDESRAIIDRYDDPRIHVLEQPQGGLVSALNFALPQMDCRYIARIDADDICFPTRLSQQLDFLTFVDAAAVSCRSLHIDEVGNVLDLSVAYQLFEADASSLPALEPYLPHPFLFIRRDVLEEVGGYRHAHLAEDSDLCWRLDERWRIALQRDVLGKYRLHTDSISSRSVRHGRTQAFFSQIAALNSKRRRAGETELPYTLGLSDALEEAGSWDQLFQLYYGYLTDEEVLWLRAAAPLKLLDLAWWRPHQIESDDIERAAKALARVPGLTSEARAEARALINRVREKVDGALRSTLPLRLLGLGRWRWRWR